MKSAEPKTVQTCFRLKPSTHQILHDRALAAGLSTKDWLDKAIVENKTKIIARQKPHPELRPLLFQVNKAGNNINQLAHHFNTMHLQNKITREECLTALNKLEGIEKALLEAVDYAR